MKTKFLIAGMLLSCFLNSCSDKSEELLPPIRDNNQKKFYFNVKVGSDANLGDSPHAPLKSLYMLQRVRLQAGDSVFLSRGVTQQGSIVLRDVHGTEEDPIVITSYGTGSDYGHIDAKGNLAGILLENCSHVVVSEVKITANGSGNISDKEARAAGMRCGVLYRVTKDASYQGITLEKLIIDNIYIEEVGYVRDPNEVNTANGTEQYGWGIRFINESQGARISNIRIKDCTIEKVSHTGIKISGKKYNITDSEISNCVVKEVGGPGIQMSGVKDFHVHHNMVDGSGSTIDSRHWGRGSGYWCWGSDRILVEHNYLVNAKGPNDSAGAHIDYNCKNVIYQYNFSANNVGAFCEILGNNYNCCYRYNISVNDGQRKKAANNENGYTFLISGYTGGVNTGPYNSYIYNNTIYTNPASFSRIALTRTASGLCIVNNIFYVSSGKAVAITTDQFVGPTKNAFMSNNLFLAVNSWHTNNHLQDASPVYGDAQFANPGGLKIEDYIAGNKELVKDKGIAIAALPADEIGLFKGLEVTHDILGNPIKGNPDFGAIELE